MNKSEQLIACLEGELAKRDEELAACRVAVENCEVFRARIDELKDDLKCAHSMLAEVSKSGMALRAELAAIKAQEPVAWVHFHNGQVAYDRDYVDYVISNEPGDSLDDSYEWLPVYAAPVSEAKAQGVVMPERWNVPRPMWKDARQPYGNPLNHADIEAAEKFNLALDEVARLNAAPVQQDQAFCEYCGGNDEEPQDHCMDCTRPVQQVSVQDGWRLVPVEPNEAIRDAINLLCDDLSAFDDSDAFWSYLLAAAPAAPAADASHVFYGMDGNHP